MPAPRKYPQELRERAIRLAQEARGENPDTLRGWAEQAEIERVFGRCGICCAAERLTASRPTTRPAPSTSSSSRNFPGRTDSTRTGCTPQSDISLRSRKRTSTPVRSTPHSRRCRENSPPLNPERFVGALLFDEDTPTPPLEHLDPSCRDNSMANFACFGWSAWDPMEVAARDQTSMLLGFQAPSAGIEPATKRLEGSCSIR
jgi:hypothetical protein